MSDAPAPHALLRAGIVVPFLLVSLIWGSTWFVITGQIGSDLNPSWAVAGRFAIAAPAMFLVALAMRRSLHIGARGHLLALALGLVQFCLNLNLVYRAELHLTSGIVATVFGLQIVTNAALARMVLAQPVTRSFALGTVVALSGVALLLLHEAQAAPLGGNIALGIALTIGGIVAASVANIAQAGETGRSLPMASLLAWGMLYGAAINAALAFVIAGPPAWPSSGAFWAGLGWPALAGSVATFPMHYFLVREIGAGKAAYSNVLVIVVAMLLSTLFEGYRWTALPAAGAVLALAGLLIALRARRPAR